jgi:putative dehydrogenase
VYAQQRRLAAKALSAKVFRISEKPGDGARTKLVNNLLAGINLVGAAEALALASRLGLDLATHPGRDRAVQRAELDRLGPPAAGDRRRLRAARPCDAAAKRHPAGRGGGPRRGLRGPAGPARQPGVCRGRAGGLAGEDDAALFKHLGGKTPQR